MRLFHRIIGFACTPRLGPNHLRSMLFVPAAGNPYLDVLALSSLVGNIGHAEVNACQRHSFKMLEGIVGKLLHARS